MRIAILIITLMICSCASNKPISSEVRHVRFGSGGGFTGEVIGYELSHDGGMTLISHEDTTQFKTIKRQEINELFRIAESIEQINVMEPSNMYQYIEVDYISSNKRWVWGKEFIDLPSEINSFYQRLSSLTN